VRSPPAGGSLCCLLGRANLIFILSRGWFFRGGYAATPFKKNTKKRGDAGVNFFGIFFIY